MKCNITLYGPTHTGKSTLAGYVITNKLSEEEIERMDHKIINELGNQYDPAQRFAYYVDRAAVERVRITTQATIGTSKYIHYNPIDFGICGDVLLIDSPGSSRHWKEKYKSSFLGDVGILVYNISSFSKFMDMGMGTPGFERERKKLLWQIDLWKNYKSLDYLIIALSKMDGEREEIRFYSKEYSRMLFGKAVLIIRSDPELRDVPIIPYAIDVKNRIQHNVYVNTSLLEWYSGHSLMDEIEIKVRKWNAENEAQPYVFASIVEKKRSKKTMEPVFRIKLLSGELRKSDNVILTQVSDGRNKEFKLGTASIKSMKMDHRELSEVFLRGSVGGVALSKIKVDGKSIDAGDLELSRTSYLVDSRMQTKMGNLLRLRMKKDIDRFDEFCMRDKINILMFGKIVSGILLGRWTQDEQYYFDVYTEKYPLVLPVDDNGALAFPNYVIEKDNIEFIQVELFDLMYMDDEVQHYLLVEFSDYEQYANELQERIKDLPVSSQKGGMWIFKINKKNVELIASRLRAAVKRNGIKKYTARLSNTEENKV